MTHRLWRQGFKIVEVPIIFTERAEGHSKMSGHISAKRFVMVWRLWLQNGLRRWPRNAHTKTKTERRSASKSYVEITKMFFFIFTRRTTPRAARRKRAVSATA
jgi:hypothetical protein